MRNTLLRFNGTVKRDPGIEAWFAQCDGELGKMARRWFQTMRACGDEVREVLHDGSPVACLGDAPFACVTVFRSHMNVGFFHGATQPDPARLLQGTGKHMRHTTLRAAISTAPTASNAPSASNDPAALERLIAESYGDIKARVENG